MSRIWQAVSRFISSIFRFRDPVYVERVPAKQRGDLSEADPVQRAKLAALKERVRRSGLAFRDNYPDPPTLGQWVPRDLTAAVPIAVLGVVSLRGSKGSDLGLNPWKNQKQSLTPRSHPTATAAARLPPAGRPRPAPGCEATQLIPDCYSRIE
jgi:hypothetical protein